MTDIKPGDRVTSYGGDEVYTVEALDPEMACLRAKNGNVCLARRKFLALIPPKIAEPGIGETAWDFYEPAGKRIPFTRLAPAGKAWSAFVNGHWVYLDWSDLSDDVTLAVDPKAGA